MATHLVAKRCDLGSLGVPGPASTPLGRRGRATSSIDPKLDLDLDISDLGFDQISSHKRGGWGGIVPPSRGIAILGGWVDTSGVRVGATARPPARPQGVLAGPGTPRDPKSHLFVTKWVAIQPFWTFLARKCAEFRPGSRRGGPGA